MEETMILGGIGRLRTEDAHGVHYGIFSGLGLNAPKCSLETSGGKSVLRVTLGGEFSRCGIEAGDDVHLCRDGAWLTRRVESVTRNGNLWECQLAEQAAG